MWRETGLIRVGLLSTMCVLVGACAASEPGADAPDAEEMATPAEPAEADSPATADLDVKMSFGDDEAAEDEKAARGYTPPPTRAYSPSKKMSEADRPTK
jgi:hypothetical protein